MSVLGDRMVAVALAFAVLELGASASAVGLVLADRELGGAAAWGTILGALGAGALATAAFSLPVALLAAGLPVGAIAAGAFVTGAGMMFFNAIWESALQRRIPPDSLSRVSAYDWLGSLALYPVGLAIWGPLSALLGLHAALWVAAALLLATTAALLSVPDVRRLESAR